MRCFTVGERISPGIYTENVGGSLCVMVGNEPVKLDDDLTSALQYGKKRVTTILRDCLLTGSTRRGVLSYEENEKLEGIYASVCREDIQLCYADIRGDKLMREQERNQDALVLLETCPGPGGQISFKSTTYNEVVSPQTRRVEREYRSIFPPPGVTILKEGKDGDGNLVYLLRMMPNSGVRIERTNVVDSSGCGGADILSIIWKGKTPKGSPYPLLMFSPERQRTL